MQRRLLMNGGPIVGCFPRPPRNYVVQYCNAIDEGVKIIPLNLNLTNAVIKRMSSSCYLLSDSLLLPCMLCFLLLYLQGRFIPIKSYPLVPSRWRNVREKLSFDLSTKIFQARVFFRKTAILFPVGNVTSQTLWPPAIKWWQPRSILPSPTSSEDGRWGSREAEID